MKEIAFIRKTRNKWLHLRLQPIRVFCFHQVSDSFNPFTTWKCDWTQTNLFKSNILKLKEQYAFISLPEAQDKLIHDKIRLHKYAVLTADDGYRSLLNILPWLEENQIPITLFINTKYLDKVSWSSINEEQARRTKPDVDMEKEVCPDLFLSKKELFSLKSPLVSLGLHGHEHLDATKQSEEEFRKNVERCRELLSTHPRYVPFFAYTWGRHNSLTDEVLREMDLVPVLANGMKNYDGTRSISRICIDGKAL